MAKQTERKPYPSDLCDAEWQKVEPHLPKRKSPRGRKREHPLREIVNAIFYVLRSGCAWRMMLHDLPPWKTVYHSNCQDTPQLAEGRNGQRGFGGGSLQDKSIR